MAPTTSLVPVLLVGIFLLTQPTSAEEEKRAVKIPGQTSIRKPTGQRLQVPCTANPTNRTLKWLNPQNMEITTNTSFRVHVNEENVLSYNELELNDTGLYTCMTTDGAHNATLTLVVFVMPTYMIEGMVILIINACLLGVFALCLIQSCIRNRRKKESQSKSDKLHEAERKQTI